MAVDTTVIGAGPAGIVAAMTLARRGRSVRLYEKAETVGHRFAGDFQGLENWSSNLGVVDRLAALGVKPTFDRYPFHEVTFYDRALRPTVALTDAPMFHLVRRGSEAGSLDRSLLRQAVAAGVDVLLGQAAPHAHSGDIIAIGPRFADGLVTGYVFPTRLKDQAHCIVSDLIAPAGYAYLLICDGRATLATCLFEGQHTWNEARDATVNRFRQLVPGIDLSDARPFSGYGSVFGSARFTDEAGRLYVGEAAGLQDPEWGFGMWLAMESGQLAARSLVDGFDYASRARSTFEPMRKAAFANRFVYERLPARVVSVLLRRAASSPNLLHHLQRHWKPTRAKSAVARFALPVFTRTRLRHRDRACHSPTCDCVWCSHGPTMQFIE
jgi:flavin-dependent dehydrogenase